MRTFAIVNEEDRDGFVIKVEDYDFERAVKLAYEGYYKWRNVSQYPEYEDFGYAEPAMFLLEEAKIEYEEDGYYLDNGKVKPEYKDIEVFEYDWMIQPQDFEVNDIYAVQLVGDKFMKFYYLRGRENAVNFMKKNVEANSDSFLYYARLYEAMFDDIGILTEIGDPIFCISKKEIEDEQMEEQSVQ